jgi:hypothetical protein
MQWYIPSNDWIIRQLLNWIDMEDSDWSDFKYCIQFTVKFGQNQQQTSVRLWRFADRASQYIYLSN